MEVRHLTKEFPGVRALDDVSLSIRAGEVHALVGENGAGKSTLVKILSGVDPADGGELLLNGQPYRPRSPEEALVAGVVILIFLLHLRSSLAILPTLPLSVLMSFIVMYWLGVDSNIMSLAGLAIAIGDVADMGIIMTENIYRRVANEPDRDYLTVVKDGASEVGTAILTAVSNTIISFIPVFALTDQDGFSAYTHSCDRFGVAGDLDVDAAGAAHGYSLQADDVPGGFAFDQAIAYEVAAQRSARAARGGVFDDAEVGREHAAVNGLGRSRW